MKKNLWTIELETIDFNTALTWKKYLDYLDDDFENEHIKTSKSTVYKSEDLDSALKEFTKIQKSLNSFNDKKARKARAYVITMEIHDEESDIYECFIAPKFPIEEYAEYIAQNYCFEIFNSGSDSQFEKINERTTFEEWYREYADGYDNWMNETERDLIEATVRFISTSPKWKKIYKAVARDFEYIDA